MTIAADEKIAMEGGTPAKSTPYAKQPRYGDEELKELKEALAQGTLFYAHGKKVAQLEKDFAAKLGAKHAVACSSGTASIHAAMMTAGISPGDEVIVPPITDMGSILPILWQGAIPVFVDLDPKLYNLSPAAIEKAITPKTKAILAVHLAGNPCDLRAIKAIADKHKIILIEDCAQAHGTTYDGKPVGTVGQLGCFSYNEFKHIACGDGGLTITNDDALGKKLKLSVDKCYDRSPGATQRNATFMANNYRMTELQGAVAVAQLRKLDSIIQRRQSWCERLTKRLGNLPGVQLPTVTPHGTHTYWFYMMRIDAAKLGGSVDEFANARKAEGVPVGAHYIGRPIYKYPLFLEHTAFEHGDHPFKRVDYHKVSCPVAEAILDTCVNLAINEAYSDADLEDTVKAFERVVGYFQAKK